MINFSFDTLTGGCMQGLMFSFGYVVEAVTGDDLDHAFDLLMKVTWIAFVCAGIFLVN